MKAAGHLRLHDVYLLGDKAPIIKGDQEVPECRIAADHEQPLPHEANATTTSR